MTEQNGTARARDLLRDWLAARLGSEASAWYAQAARELADGIDDAAFCATISKASRYLPRGPLEPTRAERASAAEVLPGWNPERWTLLETGRVALVLAHPGRADERIERAIEEAFRYSEVGEQCALYRSLALLEDPARFAWRAGEGARSNMRTVFEATCCDTPYPSRWFDDVAWRSAVIKCLFVEGPLWRIHGLDGRIDAELARMALDLADERRSAGRAVYPELWLCLGGEAGQRGLESLEREASDGPPAGRAAAALGLARAGHPERARSVRVGPAPPEAEAGIRALLAELAEGRTDQTLMRHLDPAAVALSPAGPS